MRIFKLYVFFFVVAHWVGCFWVLIEDDSEFDEKYSLGEQYAHSLLQGMLLLTKNPLETQNEKSQLFQVVVMFFATCYTAMLFGNMVVLIDNMDQAHDFYSAKMDLINEHMRYMKLPVYLQDDIRNYFEYLWIRHRSLIYGEEHIQDIGLGL